MFPQSVSCLVVSIPAVPCQEALPCAGLVGFAPVPRQKAAPLLSQPATPARPQPSLFLQVAAVDLAAVQPVGDLVQLLPVPVDSRQTTVYSRQWTIEVESVTRVNLEIIKVTNEEVKTWRWVVTFIGVATTEVRLRLPSLDLPVTSITSRKELVRFLPL